MQHYSLIVLLVCTVYIATSISTCINHCISKTLGCYLCTVIQDSILSTPMIFLYENCNATPSPITFDLYYANTISEGRLVNGELILGPNFGNVNDPFNFELRNSYVQPLIQLHPDQYLNQLSYYCTEPVTGYYSAARLDPTASMIACVKWPSFTQVYSILPVPSQPTSLTNQRLYFHYYLLFGTPRPRNCSDAFAIVAVSSDVTNITIKSSVDLVALQNGRVIINITANSPVETVISMERKEVLWIEAVSEECKSARLRGSLVKATQEVVVFTASVQCSRSGIFNNQSHILYQIPPSYKWGKTFISDLHQLNILPHSSKNGIVISFTLLAINVTNVIVTWYSNTEQQHNHKSKNYTLKSGQTFVVTSENNPIALNTSHVSIQGSNPLLVIYEVYSSLENEVYYSVLLQPAEWFSNQQSVVLAKSHQETEQQYHITLVIPSKFFDPSKILVSDTSQTNNDVVPLDRYNDSYQGHIYTSGDFIVLYIELNSTEPDGDDKQLLISQMNPCATLGVTVYSYAGDTTGYAYSNGYVIGNLMR